ncbi:MAG: hypothetical protein J0H27_13665 [Xanthomonadales bacterium]|nr:hypothetical protein [Xanthomonadales bacterium]ODU92874.1 MAG: hypothetical protein ABT18_10255 [Rhodanobacter sp. SCN 66-43]OJY83664.1 MAG: hypothetical protein BGP23_13480 [Xanthomonadales bacterium 66-474]
MKILTVCVVAALELAAVTGAFAAEANQAVANRDFTDTVAPSDQQAYEAGVKAWNQCLRDHGSKYAWTAWVHETGDVYSYSYVTGPHTWADFDTMHDADKACSETWRTQANPHLKSETSAFMVDQPDMSYMPKDWATQAQPALIDVTYFTLQHGHAAHTAFTDAAKKIAAAAAKSKWPYHFRFLEIQAGGEDAPDYILVLPNKSWADYGAEANPSLWKMVESVYGKADTDALRKSLSDAIKKSSEHIDSYNADLSYTASK